MSAAIATILLSYCLSLPSGMYAQLSPSEIPGRVVPLSVIVATSQPWPELRMCLDSLHVQAVRAGAEVVVGDGTGQGLPEDVARRYPEVTWLKVQGASVLQLRALAMSHTSGEVVAVTEDHCRVAPDWCERILEAHKRYPEAAAIGGAVENGARRKIIDWASFFIVNDIPAPAAPRTRTQIRKAGCK